MKKSLKNLVSNPIDIEENKLVSFVIPIFETEDYLEKCLLSLLNQDYKKIEIICIADGRNDKAEKIYNKLHQKDGRLVRYETIQHGGAPKTRNHGYKYTTGDYVSFWDSDCYAETGMVRMWIKMFNLNPDASFVYSGYRFNDDNKSYMNSEPFDPYLLTCGNYIATMFPMKREIFPGFDENLQSLQDWDMWLTLSEKGYKGVYLEGSAFTTEFREGSISSVGCSNANWLDRFDTVRRKHNITDRTICFSSFVHKKAGLELATMFKQDFSNILGILPHDHKVIWAIGCYPNSIENTVSIFKNAPKECKKILHWTGIDVENMFNLPFRTVKIIVNLLNQVVDKHYVEYEQGSKMLCELGIDAEVLLIPTEYKKVPMSKEFKVYYEYDNAAQEFINSVVKSCPDIKFESPDICKLEDYACCLMISQCPVPSENLKKFLASGRYAITNYRIPYANYVSVEDLNKSKSEIVECLRNFRKSHKKGIVNDKQIEYWENQIYPKKMEEIINELKKT